MLFLLLFLIFDFANALFIPVGGQDITYTSARSGTCTGSRVGPRMFAGNGDNSGANKITRCGEWCLKRNTPLQANGIDVWINVDQTTTPRVLPFKDLRGFAVDSTGRCYCEMAPVVGPDMCTTVFAGSYQSYAFECPLWYYLDDGGGTISVNSECKACPRGTEGEVFNYAYPLEQCSDINECELISGSFPTNPCHNGGTCTESSTRAYIPVGEINCDCQSGFDGENCQNTKCANGGIQACQNGGICLDKCYCPAGYVGERCERQTEAGAPCNNGMNYKGSSLVPQKVLGHQNGNIAEYCYNSGSYSNQYRPYDGASDNPGTTYDEKLLHCFRACIDFDGAGTSLGPNDAYTDKTYFQNHEWWQTPHVLMNLDGRCYCYGSHLEVVDHECVDAASTYLLSAYYRGYNVIHNCEAAHSEHVVTLGSGRDRPMCDTCERSLDCASSLTCGQPKPAGYGSGSLDYNFAKGRQCLPDTVQDPQNRFCYTGSVDPYPALGLVKDSSLTRDEIFRKCSNACLQSGYVGFNMAAPQVGSTNIPDSSQTFDGCFCNAVTYANCAAGSQGAYAGPTGDGQYYEMHEYTSAGLGFDPSWVSAVATTIDECADACRDAWYGSCQLNQVCTEFTGDFHENQNAGDGISGPLTSNDQNPMILLSGNKPTLIFGGIGDARYFKMIQTDFYGNMLSTGYLVTKDLPFNPDPSSNYAMDISELTLALWNARLVPLAFPAAQTTCLNNRYCLQDFEITGSWNQANTGFVYGYAKGFVFNKDQQNCWCDANDSGRDDVCDVSSRPNSAYRRYDFNALWDADYVWAHQYECNSKPNNAADQIIQPLAKSLQACADSCRGLFWSLSRASKGFIYRSVANGGPMCYCEAVHSYPHSECSGTSGGIGTNPDWNRYDFIPNYAFMHYGECRGGPGISNSETQIDRGTGHSLDECAILCKDYTWNNNGGPKTSIGFIYNEGSDSCYCEALYSHPHPDCARATDTLSWARYDYVNYSPVIEFKQDSQCMLTAYSLQPSTTALTGTDEEKAVQCGRVCQGAVVPQYGVDQGFGATGFVVSGTICRCESVPSDSSECDEVSGWKRYDFKIAAGSAYETFGYCAPASSVYQFVDEDQSHTTVEDWSESCRAGCVAHTPQVSHFTFNLLGGCYCMQTGGGAHTEHPCETGSIVISVGSGWYVYTIWDGGVTDVPGCANAGQDVRGLGVCVLDCTASPVASADGSNGEFYCINGGTATGFIGDCGCLCAPGFSGTNCEVNINECAPIPCVNGGVCSDGIASYSCACAGYSGENCEIVDACVGTEAATTTAGEIHCVSSTGSVSGTTGNCLCTCDAGYEGAGCATPKQCVGTEAATTTAGEIHCVSSTGSVSGTTGNCLCTCNDGYTGADCGTADDCFATEDATDLGLDGYFWCINNGIATGTTGNCGCTCQNGFSGDHCHECAPGSGYIYDYFIAAPTCVNCAFGSVNNQVSHIAACSPLGCAEGYGHRSDIDDGTFSFTWDPDDTSTNSGNCRRCPPDSQSLANDGQCVSCNAGYEGMDCLTPMTCTASQTEPAPVAQVFCLSNRGYVSGTFSGTYGDPYASGCVCHCNTGYVGAASYGCGIALTCVDTENPSDDGSNGNFYCEDTGSVSGTTGNCLCTCNAGYEGDGCATPKQCVGTEAATTTAGEIHCVSSTGSVSGTTGNCLCTCNAGYEGAGCATPKQCVGTEAATTTAGEIHCVSSTGSVSGTTGNCLCTCNAGYEGAGCATPKQCVGTEAATTTAGEIHCVSSTGSVSGTTGNCLCTCNAGYEGAGCATPKQCVGTEAATTTAGEIHCVSSTGSVSGTTGNCLCTCNAGYEGAGCATPKQCVGTEAATTTAGEIHCVSSTGSVSGTTGNCLCTCNAGYEGAGCATPKQCVGTEAATTTAGEIHCVSSTGSVSGTTGNCLCTCNAGYEGAGCATPKQCVGTEAATTTAGEIHCVSSTGSVSGTTGNCLCTCNAGYEGAGCATPKQCVGTEAATTTAGEIHCVSSTGSVSGTTGNCLCTCNAGYEGAGCATPKQCVETEAATTTAGEIHCVSSTGSVSGTTGNCLCTCNAGYEGAGCATDIDDCAVSPCINNGVCNDLVNDYNCACINGFSGKSCDECAAGSGFDGSACVPCENTQANNLITHDAVCANQTCSAGFGVVTDGFDFSLDPLDTTTTNCVACTGIQASPAGNGVCITQTCGENEQVVSVGFDASLDPTSSNSNCEACAAGFVSTGGLDPLCVDINECDKQRRLPVAV